MLWFTCFWHNWIFFCQDVEKEIKHKGLPGYVAVKHINYDDYDGHRHPINVVESTPLHEWFKESLKGSDLELNVNSYHHQVSTECFRD
jgi:gamma-glutamyl-gamma-aminobutyrate hydrolase PuuD